MTTFETLDVGAKFFDPVSGDYFMKVCGNAAEFLTGGDVFTGQLVTFDDTELVDLATPN